ncbi:hypothetical protein EV384_6340 [Micromonospora kangleipakensis]|uniref:Uncharacterized protein n=1 Tax=Micromonospora kangleipakensis TaxID=1077942 RepID=A0A4Q8BJR4_9ACTN|nr:hypothetical protein [Micromonospora kangleipakensis]RZU77609.1 hypothetical protein EV384_6340 [Micromonospora kangleipakensis]
MTSDGRHPESAGAVRRLPQKNMDHWARKYEAEPPRPLTEDEIRAVRILLGPIKPRRRS